MSNRGWIPRNLTNDDEIKLGLGIKLKMLDLPIIGTGGLISYLVNSGGGNPIIMVVSSGIIVGCSYLITKIKHEGQQSNELVANGMIYLIHQAYYKKKRGGTK